MSGIQGPGGSNNIGPVKTAPLTAGALAKAETGTIASDRLKAKSGILAAPASPKAAKLTLANLPIPERPWKAMASKDANDAWVKEGATALTRGLVALKVLKAGVDVPGSGVTQADVTAAEAKLRGLGQALAKHDERGLRQAIVGPALEDANEAFAKVDAVPPPPKEPEARAAWLKDAKAALEGGEAAYEDAKATLGAYGVQPNGWNLQPWATTGQLWDHSHGVALKQLHDTVKNVESPPPPPKKAGLMDIVKGVVEISGAVHHEQLRQAGKLPPGR